MRISDWSSDVCSSDLIETVMRHCGPRIASWDVVNEAVDPETGGLIEIALSRAMGGAQQSVDLAFHAARAQAPEAALVYAAFMSWGAGRATRSKESRGGKGCVSTGRNGGTA